MLLLLITSLGHHNRLMKTFFNGLCKVEVKQHAKVTEPSATQVLGQSSTECFLMSTLKKFWLGSINQTFVKISQKNSKLFLFYLREISCTYCVPEPWDVGGCQGSTSSCDTCPHMGSQIIQILSFREGKGLAFVPFSSAISHLSTKLLWRWILGRADTDRWIG